MLKDAEFAIFERKLEAIFEIFISIDDSSFLVLPLERFSIDDNHWYLNVDVFCWSTIFSFFSGYLLALVDSLKHTINNTAVGVDWYVSGLFHGNLFISEFVFLVLAGFEDLAFFVI